MKTQRCSHYHIDCAHAVGSHCKLLNSQINAADCPFYKTDEELEAGRKEAHQHLVDIGRYDLIEKYEFNKLRTW